MLNSAGAPSLFTHADNIDRQSLEDDMHDTKQTARQEISINLLHHVH
jgi:hypothetical protein